VNVVPVAEVMSDCFGQLSDPRFELLEPDFPFAFALWCVVLCLLAEAVVTGASAMPSPRRTTPTPRHALF
jgi:hypothetical protein